VPVKRQQISMLTGFILLAATATVLLIFGLYVSLQHSVIVFLLTVWMLAGTAAAAVSEGRKGKVREKDTVYDLKIFSGVFIGAIITFQLQAQLGMGAVAASSIVGLAGGIIFPRYAAAVYCGSFAGMCSPEIFPFFPCMTAAAFLCGVFFVLSRGIFEGAGGKLGTIAFAASLAVFALFPISPASSAVPLSPVSWIILAYSAAGAAVTRLLSSNLRLGPVIASAAVGLAAAVFLPLIHRGGQGELFAAAAFCASFAGMASPERIPAMRGMAAAGFLCGFLFIFTAPFGEGGGGKLGTIAFASVLSITGWKHVTLYVKQFKK